LHELAVHNAKPSSAIAAQTTTGRQPAAAL
jgi:hypothetical protein